MFCLASKARTKLHPMATSKARNHIAEKQLQLRNSLWPNLRPEEMWGGKDIKGWTPVPRTMPLIMEIMDRMSKAKPVSHVYLDLWCRAFEENFVVLNKQQEMAVHSGYQGQ